MRINFQVVSLRFVALGLSALLAVLAIGSIEAIARVGFANGQLSSRADQVEADSNSGESASVSSWSSWQIMPQVAAPTPSPVPTSAPTSAPTVPPRRPDRSPSPAARPANSAPAPAAARPAVRPVGNQPRQQLAPANPTNYGERVSRDVFGKPVNNAPIIVLHETVGSADSAIELFRAAHTDESMQASYHSIIRLDGTIVYIVSPEKRAFGAGNSVFRGSNGAEAVKTHRQFPPSVNNFAYHISLETPPDGGDDQTTHSGYTQAQYDSLAWLVARIRQYDDRIIDERITTHREVDRSQSRMDPRSFDREKFLRLLGQYGRSSE